MKGMSGKMGLFASYLQLPSLYKSRASICNKRSHACKARDIYCLAIYIKSYLTPTLDRLTYILIITTLWGKVVFFFPLSSYRWWNWLLRETASITCLKRHRITIVSSPWLLCLKAHSPFTSFWWSPKGPSLLLLGRRPVTVGSVTVSTRLQTALDSIHHGAWHAVGK